MARKGFSGEIPPQNVFLDAEQCRADNPNRAELSTILYSENVCGPEVDEDE